MTGAALIWGYQWALIGAEVAWTVVAGVASRHEIRLAKGRLARLSAAPAVPGRIVSVSRSVHTDQDGTLVSFAPVIPFTTREDTTVIGFCPFDVTNPSDSRGREVTVRYQSGDASPVCCRTRCGTRLWRPGSRSTARCSPQGSIPPAAPGRDT